MSHSMTAYARSEFSQSWGTGSWELRSVNHRYLDASFRLSDDWRALEAPIRERLSKRVTRGKVECALRLRTDSAATSELKIDLGLAEKLLHAASALAALPKDPRNTIKANTTLTPLALGEVLRWPGVIETQAPDTEALSERLLDLFETTLDDFIAARKREGEKLKALILERCTAVEAIVADVKPRIPALIQAQRDKMRTRLEELGADSDSGRIEQEMVIYAQKIDVSEEMDRLQAHVSEVRHVLDQTAPVGRRLDFLMQELNREANTLGSKSVDTLTTNGSVDLKVLIEQMREQIQNLE
ncbi:MAG: hypothetical protein ACI8PT_000111 [Gammaproteobacteria bacterium]|jgi:uncharacterized protein (TIGR00255 family)